MKKLVAISLLSLYLFSLYGHMLMYAWCVYQSDKLFNEQISMDKYSLDDLVSVKVPVNMPSIQDWKDYSYVSGQVKFKDNSYNYVKIKMTRDTIFLMCIPNYKKTRLINQNIIDAQKIADIPFNKKEHVPFGKINSLEVFSCQEVQYRFLSPMVTLEKPVDNPFLNILKSSIASPGQPPEVLNSLS